MASHLAGPGRWRLDPRHCWTARQMRLIARPSSHPSAMPRRMAQQSAAASLLVKPTNWWAHSCRKMSLCVSAGNCRNRSLFRMMTPGFAYPASARPFVSTTCAAGQLILLPAMIVDPACDGLPQARTRNRTRGAVFIAGHLGARAVARSSPDGTRQTPSLVACHRMEQWLRPSQEVDRSRPWRQGCSVPTIDWQAH